MKYLRIARDKFTQITSSKIFHEARQPRINGVSFNSFMTEIPIIKKPHPTDLVSLINDDRNLRSERVNVRSDKYTLFISNAYF